MEGSRVEMLGPENDPRRDIEGASCGVTLLSFRKEATEDARESDGTTEEVRLVSQPCLPFDDEGAPIRTRPREQ